MPHLAGAPCGVCQKPLLGLRDGAFCPKCECPVHIECVREEGTRPPQGHCSRCGSVSKVAMKWRRYEDAADDERAWDAKRIVFVGLIPVFFYLGIRLFGGLILIPIVLIVFGVIGHWSWKKLIMRED